MIGLNLSAAFAHQLNRQSDSVDKIMQKISSGTRLQNAEDDVAGLSKAEAFRSQVNGMGQAQRNIQEALNIVKIGQDGIGDLLPIIDRMRELVVQGSNGITSEGDRAVIQREIDELKDLIPQAYITAKNFRIALDGKDNADRILNFQVGANAGEMVSVDYNPLRGIMGNMVIEMFGYEELHASPFREILAGYFPQPIPMPNDPVPPPPLGPVVPPGTTWSQAFPKKLDISSGSPESISQAFALLDRDKPAIVYELTYLGAISNRLESTLETVAEFEVNVAEAESRIRDTDMAKEMANLTKAQVLNQTAQAMLAQSGQRPFQVLELLRPQ